jgi:excinuclease ABC subunit A
MEVMEAKKFFSDQKKIYDMLNMLDKVGLSYIKLGQSSTTLSGGEAQRIKLAKELHKTPGNSIYILDEPTTGLHKKDVEKLNYIFEELIEKGATVIVIEHNPELIRHADYIIEMGPGGGNDGGEVIKSGWRLE